MTLQLVCGLLRSTKLLPTRECRWLDGSVQGSEKNRSVFLTHHGHLQSEVRSKLKGLALCFLTLGTSPDTQMKVAGDCWLMSR